MTWKEGIRARVSKEQQQKKRQHWWRRGHWRRRACLEKGDGEMEEEAAQAKDEAQEVGGRREDEASLEGHGARREQRQQPRHRQHGLLQLAHWRGRGRDHIESKMYICRVGPLPQ